MHSPERLQAIGRTQLAKRLFSVWSEDGGRTWGEMGLLDLPNPDSGTDAVTLSNGMHALIYNHSTQYRSPINLALSDDGVNWKAAVILDQVDQPGELSYPAIIQTSDSLIHMTYTWKREHIKHLVVDPAALELRDIERLDWPE